MGLAERMPAGDERNGLLVVHRHATERLPDEFRGKERIRVATRSLRIHVDQAHVIGAERPLDLAFAAVTRISKPRVLSAPEDLLGLPNIGTPEAEAERLESHRLHGDVPGVDQEIGPGDLPAVLPLDRPEQPARLIEVRVVGPAVEGSKALHAAAAT